MRINTPKAVEEAAVEYLTATLKGVYARRADIYVSQAELRRLFQGGAQHSNVRKLPAGVLKEIRAIFTSAVEASGFNLLPGVHEDWYPATRTSAAQIQVYPSVKPLTQSSQPPPSAATGAAMNRVAAASARRTTS